MKRCIALLFLLLPAWGNAQQSLPANGLLLIAKPELQDANFRRTVVLVTQTAEGSTVGVILNRPTQLQLSQFLSREFDTTKYRQPIFAGGPVMRQALVALYRSATTPAAPAFHVLKDVYLTMHPANIAALLANPAASYRVYAGFSGWSPGQLQSEVMQDGWHFLQADEATLFRADTEKLWEQMLERAKKSDPRGRI